MDRPWEVQLVDKIRDFLITGKEGGREGGREGSEASVVMAGEDASQSSIPQRKTWLGFPSLKVGKL